MRGTKVPPGIKKIAIIDGGIAAHANAVSDAGAILEVDGCGTDAALEPWR